MTSHPFEEAWRTLDANLLEAEAILEEEKRWVAHDVFEGIGRVATNEIEIKTDLL